LFLSALLQMNLQKHNRSYDEACRVLLLMLDLERSHPTHKPTQQREQTKAMRPDVVVDKPIGLLYTILD